MNSHFTNVCPWPVGTGRSEVGSPPQGNSGKCRLSHRASGGILFTMEGQLCCDDHHYYFTVTGDFGLGKLEKKVTCIQISRPLDFPKSLHLGDQFWHKPDCVLGRPSAFRLERSKLVACSIFTYFPEWDHLESK